MIRGLYTAVSGMITQEAKQDVITNNLANSDTIGYKSDDLGIKKFDDVLIENYDKIVDGKNVKNVIGSLSMGSQIDGTSTSYTQGDLQETDKPTDFAVDGGGFFSVARQNQLGGTQNYYTRNGHFHVDNNGYLVTEEGDKVLGVNTTTKKVEPIKVGSSKMVYEAGSLMLDGKAAYKFKMTDFRNHTDLKKVGDNLFSGNNPIDTQNASVKQYNLERSNVNVTNEVINMMTVMRTFESNQKVIAAIDETLGKAVNDVGSIR